MFDITTYIIYIFLLGGSVFLLKMADVKDESDIGAGITFPTFLFLLMISFIVGFRYNIGVDWQGYVNEFQRLVISPNTTLQQQGFESGYFGLSKLVVFFDLGYEILFFCVAFISWYTLTKGTPSIILPSVIFFMFCEEHFFWSMNGVRQFVAIGFWVWSTKYIMQRELAKFAIIIYLGSLFHSSIIFLCILYFIPFNWLLKPKHWIYYYLASLLIMVASQNIAIFDSVKNGLIFFFANYSSESTDYQRYIDSNRLIISDISVGLGFYFKIITNGLLIFMAPKVLKHFKGFDMYFIFFFIGAVMFNFFYEISLINRFLLYFMIFKVFVLGFTGLYLWQKGYREIAVATYTLYFLFFLVLIYGDSNQCGIYTFSFNN